MDALQPQVDAEHTMAASLSTALDSTRGASGRQPLSGNKGQDSPQSLICTDPGAYTDICIYIHLPIAIGEGF